MIEVKLLDKENGKLFIKIFSSPYLWEKFNNKLKRSKKLQLISVGYI